MRTLTNNLPAATGGVARNNAHLAYGNGLFYVVDRGSHQNEVASTTGSANNPSLIRIIELPRDE